MLWPSTSWDFLTSVFLKGDDKLLLVSCGSAWVSYHQDQLAVEL